MKKIVLFIVICLVVFITGSSVAEETDKAEAVPEISEEDMNVIEVMEILTLMDAMEQLELLKDMDLLIEEEGNENEN